MQPLEPSFSHAEAPGNGQARFSPPPRRMPRPRLWLHALLFLLTVASTMMVAGSIFSAGMLSILLAHEFGHYFAARSYRVPVTLPYFIPFPLSLFGTLGAFIRMSPLIPHRRALFDIAAAGPLAGLVLAIPLGYLGISLSEIKPNVAMPTNTISLGEPLLFQGLGWLAHGSLGDDVSLLLHPLAFAGWAGMFVTALNLLPIGQLDGGHISHALFGAKSRLMAQAMFGGLALYCVVNQTFTWIPLLLLLLFFGVQHPRSFDDGLPLGSGRRAVGLLLGLVFLFCFSLVPIKL